MTTSTTEKTVEKTVEKAAGSGRFCAYDNTLLKFIGGVEDSKAKVTSSDAYKAAKKADHDVEVREV